MKSGRPASGNPDPRLLAASLAKPLAEWYREHRRDLPWRVSRDPYRIWISEIMLQQTTVAAVIPYYERFLKTFPNVAVLAEAPLDEVLKLWSGLGYYSRARNLHKAAQLFAERGFPKTAAELQEFPGLGPYTSRAVSSLAFDEKVGVLDGNVIRILSRVKGLPIEHWKPVGRNQLQTLADELAQHAPPSDLNQGMMELGATVCTTHSPSCLLCPWQKNCVARSESTVSDLPLKKPRAESEIWLWKPKVMIKKNRVALVQNTELPFLKGQWVFPGSALRLRKKPERFDLRHGITHHDIYIQVRDDKKKSSAPSTGVKWVSVDELASVNPSILLKKVLQRSSSPLL